MKRNTRTKKISENVFEIPPLKKDKFEDTSTGITHYKFEAKSDNQKLAIAHLRSGKQIVGLFGSAGTGKSMLASWWAASQLKLKKIENIVLLRPNVHCGKSIGLLTGNEQEKLAPFFVQTINHLRKFIGNHVDYYLEKGIISTRAFEYVRGMSFENTIVIVEECQTLTEEEFETLLTRIGEGCQMILTGDERQVNKGQIGGLKKTLKMIDEAIRHKPKELSEEDMHNLDNNYAYVEFTPDDIVRSGFVKALVKLYYYKGNK